MNAIGTQLRDLINSGLTRWRMVVLKKKTVDAATEIGRNPVSKHQIKPEYGDEQADAGRDCRSRLAGLNSQARTGTVKIFIFPVQLTTSRIGNHTRLILTLAKCDDHTWLRAGFPEDLRPRTIALIGNNLHPRDYLVLYNSKKSNGFSCD